MTTSFGLPEPLASQGWKLKIYTRERLEPPHATVIRKTDHWRWGLRQSEFLDVEPDPRLVPDDLVELLRVLHPSLVRAWDDMHPDNPVNAGRQEGEGP